MPSGDWDIVREARRQAQEAKRVAQEAERARQNADARVARQHQARANAEARKWAVPILNATLGERATWSLTNARQHASTPVGPTERLVDVIISSDSRKTLTVHKESGKITGNFQVAASGGRYSNSPARYEDRTITSLLQLGQLLEQEYECRDEEMRYAD